MSTATPVRPGTSPAAKLVSHVATARESGIVLALVLIIVLLLLSPQEISYIGLLLNDTKQCVKRSLSSAQ